MYQLNILIKYEYFSHLTVYIEWDNDNKRVVRGVYKKIKTDKSKIKKLKNNVVCAYNPHKNEKGVVEYIKNSSGNKLYFMIWKEEEESSYDSHESICVYETKETLFSEMSKAFYEDHSIGFKNCEYCDGDKNKIKKCHDEHMEQLNLYGDIEYAGNYRLGYIEWYAVFINECKNKKVNINKKTDINKKTNSDNNLRFYETDKFLKLLKKKNYD